MKVLVAGKGFIGEAVGEELEVEHDVRYLDRSDADYEFDITESFEIEESFDVLVHTIGLPPGFASRKQYREVHVNGTENILEGVEADRIVYLSALGVGEVDHSFFRTKEDAENLIRDSGTEHVFVRPSTVYGPGNKLLELIRSFAPTRTFPDLDVETQPIHREDLVDVVAAAAENYDDEVLNAAGPDIYRMGELARHMYHEEGYRCLLLPVPKVFFSVALTGLSFLGPPFMPENMRILESSNTTDDNHAADIIDLSEIF